MRIVPRILQMLANEPELYTKSKFGVGGSLKEPQFTVERRIDLGGAWEVMERGGYRGLYTRLEAAFQSCLDMNPELVFPQEVEVIQ